MHYIFHVGTTNNGLITKAFSALINIVFLLFLIFTGSSQDLPLSCIILGSDCFFYSDVTKLETIVIDVKSNSSKEKKCRG